MRRDPLFGAPRPQIWLELFPLAFDVCHLVSNSSDDGGDDDDVSICAKRYGLSGVHNHPAGQSNRHREWGKESNFRSEESQNLPHDLPPSFFVYSNILVEMMKTQI